MSVQVTAEELEELKAHAYDGWGTPSTSKGRNDVHSPKNLVTENYEYLYSWDSQQPGALVGIAQSDIWQEWHSKGPVLPTVSSSQCTHCGAHIRYVALLRYIPTGQYLYCGEICLDNRFGRATTDFQKLRKQAELDRQAQKIKAAWEDFRATHEADWASLDASENTFVQDVLRKGRLYGALSPKQFDGIKAAIVRDAERVARKANETEETTAPVPEGKQTVVAVLLSRRTDNNDYGYVYRGLFKVTTPAGVYKLWGTVASALDSAGVQIGDIVTFSATVKRSDKDESFGFFSRPTKTAIITKAVAA